MSLLLMEGFDNWAAASYQGTLPIGSAWSSLSANHKILDTSGRRSGRCWQPADGGARIHFTLSSLPSTVIFGGAFYASGINTSRCPVFSLWMTTATVVRAQCALIVNLDGSVTLGIPSSGWDMAYAGTNQAIAGAGAGTISMNTWNYIEAKIVAGRSTGTGAISLSVGGVAKATNLAIHTRSDGTGALDTYDLFALNYLSSLFTGATNQDMGCRWDDLYILSGDGTAPNTMLGDCGVYAILANGAGGHTDWSVASGSNYQAVDDPFSAAPDSDTTYVYSSTADQIDTYTMTDLPGGLAGVIVGVQPHIVARKDDAGSRSIAPVLRLSSTDAVGTTVSIGDAYSNYSERFLTKPGGGAFTVTNVNDLEIGVKLIA